MNNENELIFSFSDTHFKPWFHVILVSWSLQDICYCAHALFKEVVHKVD